LVYLNPLTSERLSSILRIPGQIYTRDINEADVAYKYVFSSVDVMNQEVYKNGRTMMTGTVGRPYYQARGEYQIIVCFEKTLVKEGKKSTCRTIEEFARIKIEANEDLNPNVAAANWNTENTRDEVASEIRSKLRGNFSFQTGGLGMITKYKAELYTALFNLKGSKKHLKKESDKHAKNLKGLLKLYNADFGDYFAFKCVSARPQKDLTTCFKEYRDNMQAKSDLINEGIAFWKNELETKYNRKGKKVEIRNAMALNLFTAAAIKKDVENVRYAYNILSEERYGTKVTQHKGRHYNMKYLVEKLEKKPYHMIPSYYSFGSRSGGPSGSSENIGSSYPLN